jgi:hypothetical protein
MQRVILGGLSIVLFSTVMAPAMALTQRFDDARQQNLEKGLTSEVDLTERFEDARQDNLNKLTERFEDAYQDNLDK